MNIRVGEVKSKSPTNEEDIKAKPTNELKDNNFLSQPWPSRVAHTFIQHFTPNMKDKLFNRRNGGRRSNHNKLQSKITNENNDDNDDHTSGVEENKSFSIS